MSRSRHQKKNLKKKYLPELVTKLMLASIGHAVTATAHFSATPDDVLWSTASKSVHKFYCTIHCSQSAEWIYWQKTVRGFSLRHHVSQSSYTV